MVRRRSNDFDSLKTEDEPRWLTVSDMTGRVLAWLAFAPLEDLRRRFAEVLAATYAAGWDVEAFDSRTGWFFCHQEERRRYIAIQPTPPADRTGIWKVPEASSDIVACVGVR